MSMYQWRASRGVSEELTLDVYAVLQSRCHGMVRRKKQVHLYIYLPFPHHTCIHTFIRVHTVKVRLNEISYSDIYSFILCGF